MGVVRPRNPVNMRRWMMKNNEIMVIPDAHDTYGIPKERFSWAMQLAVIRQPGIIVNLGDWSDLPSLCEYDKGTVRAEGKRLALDLESTQSSLKAFFKPLENYNKSQKKKHKKGYNPKIVFLIGNHEERLNRLAHADPKLHGQVGTGLLDYAKWGIEVVPFLKPYMVEGICFKHYFTSGVMGKAIGGENHAQQLVKKNYMSCVCGHSHTRGFWETVNANGERVCGLVCGCYFEHDHEFTTENSRYWRGLVYLRDVSNGSFQPEFVGLDTLREMFTRRGSLRDNQV